MRKTHRAAWRAALAVGLSLAVGGLVQAGDLPQAPNEGAPGDGATSDGAMATLHWSQPATPAAEPATEPRAASDETLGAEAGRGTDQTALTEQSLSAINTGNTIKADTVGSGSIGLSGGALSGFAGVGNIMMNTGHNNNLESNMSVTILITP
jgi:hypothetical protein